MRLRSLIVPIAVVAPLLLAPACSEDEQPPVVEPTSAFQPTGSTGSTGSTAATGSAGETRGTGNLPTTTPGAATGTISRGQATFALTGGIRASKVLENLVSTINAPPPGGMALVWTAGGTDATTVGLGGLSFTGTQPTSPALSLSITVQNKGAISTFVSSADECTITIGQASAEQISGAFTCSDLSGGSNVVVDATGSFNAQG